MTTEDHNAKQIADAFAGAKLEALKLCAELADRIEDYGRSTGEITWANVGDLNHYRSQLNLILHQK